MGVYEERRSTRVDATMWRSVAAGPHRVLPDGCMDVLWWRGRLVVAGADTGAHLSDVRRGESVVGVRFDPGVLPALLGVPATEVTDQRVELTEFLGAGRTRRIAERLEGAADPWALERVLLDEVGTDRDTTIELSLSTEQRRHLVRRIDTGCSVAALADETGWSERQLLRRSRHVFGYGPTVLRRVLRLQRALEVARSGRPLADVAVDTGYSDQAHLSRDVRSLTGTSLGRLLG